MEDSQLEDMCIDVVSVTWKELNDNQELRDELLGKADLLYFADPNNRGFKLGDDPDNTDDWIVQFDFDDASGYMDSGLYAIEKGNASSAVVDDRNVVYLDGNGDYLNVEGLFNDYSGEELTVSFMAKIADSSVANWMFFAEPEGYTQAWPREQYLGIFEKGGTITSERYKNSGSRPANPSWSGNTSGWTRVTVSYKAGNTEIYIGEDSQPVSSVDSSIPVKDILAGNTAFQIGRASWEGGEYYKGWIDDFTVAGQAMTPSEIDAAMQANATGIYNAIVKKVSEGLPVVLNRSLYNSENNDMAVRKMAACLMRDDILEAFGNDGVDGRAVTTMSLAGLKSSMITATDFVSNNVFVYDDALIDGAADDGIQRKTVVSNAFLSEYSDEKVTVGFSDAVAEIENENFYLEVAGKTDVISSEITMATAIRHILNYGDKRNVTKTSLRVLDLEPYDFEDYYPESDYVINGPTDSAHKHKTVYNDIKSKDADRDTAAIIETDSICITDGKLDKTGWLVENIAPQFEGDPNGLEVTIMGTKEFIGKLDDLNAEYDLIYLGMDTSIMNTRMEGSGSARTKTDETLYNDETMNGLVYSHVGDEFPVWSAKNAIHGNYRLSGNDITFDKLRELKEYIEAGYAVIISDGFLVSENNTLKVNTKKVDKSSNMYKLINETVLATDDNGAYRYYGKNVNSKSNLETGAANVKSTRETFNRYLGISKLVLKYTEADLPAVYNEADGITSSDYLSPDSDGIYRLRYTIELQNDAAVAISSTYYDCKLYVDMDADGRYEEEERLTGLSISDSNGGSYQADGGGRYNLRAGEKYQISREIPEGYTGFLAWKLVFEMNDRTYLGTDDRAVVRSNIVGYSAVPVSGIKPTINVLQITTHDAPTDEDDKTTLNLAEETPPNNDVPSMTSLYAGVNDFDIKVTLIPSSAYVSRDISYYNECDTYEEYIKQFDMLVLGFTDMYQYGNGIGSDHIGNEQGSVLTEQDVIDSMLAIREYALSGRSVMFTHDLNSMQVDMGITGFWRNWGWYANQILRDIQGMDRFGTLRTSSLIPDDKKYEYDSKYDEAYLKGESVEDEGLSNPVILDWNHKAQLVGQTSGDYYMSFEDVKSLYTYGENSRLASWNFATHLDYQANRASHGYSSYVSQVNSGQITEYPYNIADTFAATHSHPQYLQLNMDTNSRDANNNDDIVVWYALDKIPEWCDSLFGANEMDVRNNFFIYNKGNITYTGSGDSEVLNEMERKLFVNTLVASYRSGTHAARTFFKENEWETSATITTTYLPYDPAMNSGNGGFLDETLAVNFMISNMDLRKSDEALNVKYYVDGTDSNYTIKVDGKPYIEIAAQKAYRLLVQEGAIVKSEEDPTKLSNNSMHQVEFTYESLGLMADPQSIQNKHMTNLYVRLGYDEMEAVGDISLPAAESIGGLNIICTQLFELK